LDRSKGNPIKRGKVGVEEDRELIWRLQLSETNKFSIKGGLHPWGGKRGIKQKKRLGQDNIRRDRPYRDQSEKISDYWPV